MFNSHYNLLAKKKKISHYNLFVSVFHVVFHVQKDRYARIYSSDALTVYSEYFDIYPSHQTVLFLLVPRNPRLGFEQPFLVEELIDYFKYVLINLLFTFSIS